MTAATIHMFPCLTDNYGLLLHDPQSGLTASIDTPDATEISKQCAAKGWTLSHILNTHHHWDHTGGNLDLLNKTQPLRSLAPPMMQSAFPA